MGGLAVTVGVVEASGVVNLTGAIQVSWMAWALRQHIRWRYMLRLVPGIVCGLALGLSALKGLDPTHLIRALGVTIVAIALWNLRPLRTHGTGSPAWDFAVGFSSGAIGGAFNTGGPPIVAYLYRRPDPPEALKATVQITFVFFTFTRMAAATAVGLNDGEIVRLAALGTPFVVAGAMTGLALGRRVSAERFRTASWVGLSLLGAWLVVRA
jgi:uncharacterized membrane protein YfcA